jgi:flap endonuclease-1
MRTATSWSLWVALVGFNLSPLVTKQELSLEDLNGLLLAVDGNNNLYQFLALIRMRDGRSFTDATGHVTSHLVGLLMRTTRLISDYNIRPVFIFDGKPPELKMNTLKTRRDYREMAHKEWEAAIVKRDYSTAWSKAVRMNSLTQPMISDAKKVLELLGIPIVQAPSEGEAQAAKMAIKGDVWATNSRDYDSVLFGSPRLVRYVTISGQEFLPSKGVSRPLIPELIELSTLLNSLGITREQLVDLAILVGTDFNEGIKGVGPKTALKLIRAHGSLDQLPPEYANQLPPEKEQIRKLFLNPDATNAYDLRFKGLDKDGLKNFLCDQRGFSPDRVELAVRRMERFYGKERRRSGLDNWIK